MLSVRTQRRIRFGPPRSGLATAALALAASLALIVLFVVATPGTALVGFVSILFFAASILVLLRWPAGFLGLTMGSYGSLQALLLKREVVHVGSVEINASKAFILLVTLLLASRLAITYLTRARERTPPRAVILGFFLVAWTSFAAIRSPLPSEAIAVVARMLAGAVACFYAFVFVRSTKDLLPVWLGSAVTTIVASVIALLELLHGRGTVEVIATGAFRGAGGFGGAVATGTVAMYGMLLAVAVLTVRPFGRSQMLLALLTIIAGSLGIVVTFTRTAIFGTLVFVLLYLFASRHDGGGRQRARRLLLTLLLIIAVTAGLSLISSETLESRIADLPGTEGRAGMGTETGSGRGLIWITLLRLQAAASPTDWLIGHGLLAVPYALTRSVGLNLDAHNSLLDLLFDAGIIGAALYLLSSWAMIGDLRCAGHTTTGATRSLGRIWSYYIIAYFLSTEMFNGYVYAIGPRWYSLIATGAILGLGWTRSAPVGEGRNAEFGS